MNVRVSLAVVAGSFVVTAIGCRSGEDASVLVGFVNPADQTALVGVTARLTLTDPKTGKHPVLRVLGIENDDVDVVAVDVPLPCDPAGCGANLSIEAGTYDATVVLAALDRCAVRGDVLSFSGSAVVDHWANSTIDLTLDDDLADADEDGVLDALEATACGRFDFDEGMQPPRQCAEGRAECCGASDVEGRMSSFDGGTTTLPYGVDVGGGAVDVAGFALDATEVTWGALERCVLAGACLKNRPGDPAREALAFGIDRRAPVQGLLPADAAAVCAFYGKVLPDDAVWDFAAADRDGVRAKYPFDVDAGAVIGCNETGAGPAAAHQASEQDCPSSPLEVASYPSSFVTRGTGAPVADLAGNVAELTLVRGAGVAQDVVVDTEHKGIPDGTVAVVVRGGGVKSFVELLENDLPIVFKVDSTRDRDALKAAVADVGFRCAAAVAPVVDEEPACPAGEGGGVIDDGSGGDSVGPEG